MVEGAGGFGGGGGGGGGIVGGGGGGGVGVDGLGVGRMEGVPREEGELEDYVAGDGDVCEWCLVVVNVC